MRNKWDWGFVVEITPTMVEALGLTILLTVIATALALTLGLLWSLLNRTSRKWMVLPSRGLLHFVRGTPLIVQLFFVYYVLPDHGVVISATLCGVIVLTVHNGAFMAEVYRAGIEATPMGQWEACHALGLSRRRTIYKIILPPAIQRSIPALGNYVILLFKETAALYVIAVPILMYAAKSVSVTNFRYMEAYTLAGALYLIVAVPASFLLRRLELRGSYI